jgi:2-desacetyl-2-hydroxyethyl bacteriochlorophyllide A dehydrogenase
VRAVAIAEDRRLVTVEREAPSAGAGQAVIDVAYCGICGSDLHFREVPALFPAGTIPGHELSGTIRALGAGVEGWRVGDRVSVLPFAQCGECERCRSGEEQVCPHAVPNGVGLGTGRPGGYAEQIAVDERMLFALPDAVDDRAGALTEPLAVAVRAVEKCGTPASEPVAVIGAGTIGLLTALVLRERGFERIALVSRNETRAELARSLGLEVVDAESVAADPPACVFECAGTPAAARTAIESLRPLGRVILVGLSLEPLELPAVPIVLGELELRGILSYSRADFAAAIDLLARGRIPVERIVTSTRPLEDAEEAFSTLTAAGNTELKILLAP